MCKCLSNYCTKYKVSLKIRNNHVLKVNSSVVLVRFLAGDVASLAGYTVFLAF